MKRLVLIALGAAVALPACTCAGISSDLVFQRMEMQQKYQPYEENEFFADGRAMREPPEGTVPREQTRPGDRAFHTGMEDGELVQRAPIKMTREVLALGKKRYEIVCANCHGLLGDGSATVADNMGSRLPPNLHLYRENPDGFFFAAMTQGYGYMPSFAGEIPPEERWAVVGYIRVLQRARNIRYADLTDPEKRQVGAPRVAARLPGQQAGQLLSHEIDPLEAPSAEVVR